MKDAVRTRSNPSPSPPTLKAWIVQAAQAFLDPTAPVFVAIKGGEGHAANSLHESGRSDHPFSATLDHDVWMGQATAFVQVKEFRFAIVRYAVPVTGSEWCSPPGHPDLGRFGVRIAKLSYVIKRRYFTSFHRKFHPEGLGKRPHNVAGEILRRAWQSLAE